MARILVVDDEEDVCILLKKVLTTEGYEVYTANNGEDALSIVKKESPQIVILDILMPKMNGLNCLKRIKEIDEKVGVIMLTGLESQKIGEQSINLGAFDYIIKSFSFNYLQDCIMVKLFQMTA